MYYNTCPYCGSNNDPGEICDCLESNNRVSDSKSDNKLIYKSVASKVMQQSGHKIFDSRFNNR